MPRRMLWILFVAQLACQSRGMSADAPKPSASQVSMEEIDLLIQQHVTKLDKTLASEADYEPQKDKTVRQSLGLLACLGQYLAELPAANGQHLNGPALRDAALMFKRRAPYADAQAALKQIHEVLTGNVSGEHPLEHPWNKLIGMGAMMEEINGQNSALLKTMKRPRGTPEEVLPAVTWSILSLPMIADTHEVKDPAKLPQWNQWSGEFQQASIQLAEAIRVKDKTAARAAFDLATETCTTCHEEFQK